MGGGAYYNYIMYTEVLHSCCQPKENAFVCEKGS